MIRPVEPRDYRRVAAIYNHYIEHSIATFEEVTFDDQQMAQRIEQKTTASWPWLVAQQAGRVVGYAYAVDWNVRSGYRHTAECSIYLDAEATGKGIGSQLYTELFALLSTRPLRIVIAGIALPNGASVALHEKFGFQKVAHFQEVGFKFGQWIDVGYWQMRLGDGEGV